MKRLLALCMLIFLPAVQGYDLVTFAPTYGVQKQENGPWTIHVRAWVHESESLRMLAALGVAKMELKPHKDKDLALQDEKLAEEKLKKQTEEYDQGMKFLEKYLRGFTEDNQGGREITLEFKGGTAPKEIVLKNIHGKNETVDGVLEGDIELDAALVASLPRDGHGWCTFSAKGYRGHPGLVKFMARGPGVSVISDIDDTIKVTGIVDGTKEVLRNTFLREFKAAPGVKKWYDQWKEDGAEFHYVSGGFWQLYEPLWESLIESGTFPRGTFQMRTLPLDLRSMRTFSGIHQLTSDENEEYLETEQRTGTQGFKVRTIKQIIKDFPDRRFILIGDSGEKDPEVYDEIRKEFPGRIEIYIREVTRLGERTKGMNLIHDSTGELIPRDAVLPK